MNERLLEIATAELQGRNGLRTARPNSGVSAYLWRMVRFHGGVDTTMPVTCYFYLQDYLDKTFNKGEFNVCGIINAKGKALLDDLDTLIDPLCERFGLSPYAGARRWEGLLY
jgi:hypothetical protein